jgi:hypothetical protein
VLQPVGISRAFFGVERETSADPFHWRYGLADVAYLKGTTSPVNWENRTCLTVKDRGMFFDMDCTSYQPGVVCRGGPLSGYFSAGQHY